MRRLWVFLAAAAVASAGCGAGAVRTGDTVRARVHTFAALPAGEPLAFGVSLVRERPGEPARFLRAAEVARGAEAAAEVRFFSGDRPLGDVLRPKLAADC